MRSATVVALGLVASSASASEVIAGYTTTQDVSEHSKIDLDVKTFSSFCGSANWTAAATIFEEGENSFKSSTVKRTLAGFSKDMEGEPVFDLYMTYHTNPEYAKIFVSSALEGTGEFVGADDVARKEAATKGAVYQGVWMYVFHELHEAQTKAKLGEWAAAEKHWDEAVAFYAGSLEGVDGTGSGALIHALAEKRCQNYATCEGGDKEGPALSNIAALAAFKEGKACVSEATFDASCAQAATIKIAKQATIPLVQGLNRYLYKSDLKAYPGGGAKEHAEGWAFASAALPLLHACSASVATMVVDNIKMDLSARMKDGYKAVLAAVESCYPAMGITCAQVGALDESTAGAGDGKWKICTDGAAAQTVWSSAEKPAAPVAAPAAAPVKAPVAAPVASVSSTGKLEVGATALIVAASAACFGGRVL